MIIYPIVLADIQGLDPDDGNFIVGDGSDWVAESDNTARTSLGLGTGDDPHFNLVELTDLETPVYVLRLQAENTGISADRAITFDIGNINRILTLSGNPTLADWFDQSVKAGSSPTFVTPTVTSLLTAGNIGIAIDPDILDLSANLLTVNGSISVSDFIGIPADADLLQLTADALTVNGTINNLVIAGDDTNFNIFLGIDVFGNDSGEFNIGIGFEAGKNADSSGAAPEGDQHVFIGHQAGKGGAGGITAQGCVGIGYQSLFDITSGHFNMMIGVLSGTNITTGNRNVGIGYYTLGTCTSGTHNFALGHTSLFRLTSANFNVAIGSNALYETTTGQRNVGIGYLSLQENVTGWGSTAIGHRTLLFNNVAGLNYNTAIGHMAGGTATGVVNTTLIGAFSGYLGTTGDNNVFLGYQSGYNQTTNSSLLIIDNQDRGSVANELSKSLIYGVFDADPASQTLRLNASILVTDKLAFTQTDLNEYIDSLADGYMDYGATTAHRFNTSVDINGGLQANLVTKTGAYTATASDYTIICNASGGAFTITLPAVASHTNRIYHIKKIDNSVNAVTIDGNGAETIDDGATAILTVQYESVSVQSDGSEWWII